MSSLAARSEAWSLRRMADTNERDQRDREIAGKALQTLRKRHGFTQEEASGRAERISLPTWKNYEAGRRFMDNPTLARALRAIDATVEEHQLEVARLRGGPAGESAFFGALSDRPRQMVFPVGGIAHGGGPRPNVYDQGEEAEVINFDDFLNANTRILRLDGMSMVPYAEPGGFVTFNPRRPARRGQGAVIQMKDGSYQVKRFERLEGDKVIVTELHPVEREISYDIAEVEGVYAIGLRGD